MATCSLEQFRANARKEKKGNDLQGWDRFLTGGKTSGGGLSSGGLLSLGHKGVVPDRGDEDTLWMDEHAVRIRAGILNIFAWVSIINVFYEKNPYVAWPLIMIAMWEFLASTLFGLTPLAPIGTLATLLCKCL